MGEDRWTDADDARLAMHALPDDHPVALTMAIWHALDDHRAHEELLRAWVTPESVAGWGDFSEVAEGIGAQKLSLLGTARQYPHARDVAFVVMIRDEPGAVPRMTRDAEPLILGAVFTWVWRPELGGWRMHSAGVGVPSLDELPRSSPNVAPVIESRPVD